MPPRQKVENVARARNIAQRCCAVNIALATIARYPRRAGRRSELARKRQLLAAGLGGLWREAPEDTGEDLELLAAQLLEEALLHRCEVARLRAAHELEPGLG